MICFLSLESSFIYDAYIRNAIRRFRNLMSICYWCVYMYTSFLNENGERQIHTQLLSVTIKRLFYLSTICSFSSLGLWNICISNALVTQLITYQLVYFLIILFINNFFISGKCSYKKKKICSFIAGQSLF